MSTSFRQRAFVPAAGLLLLTGCLNVNTQVPDVQIDRGSGGASAPGEQRTPYGKELEKVLNQQAEVEKELSKRKWENVGEKVGEWAKHVRRLMGKADTSGNPARMREYCNQLLGAIQTMQSAADRQDGGGVRRGMDQANPWLNRLSAEFPLTTSAAPPPAQPPPAGTRRETVP